MHMIPLPPEPGGGRQLLPGLRVCAALPRAQLLAAVAMTTKSSRELICGNDPVKANMLFARANGANMRRKATLIALFTCAAYYVQEEGKVTLRLMSKAGRVSSAGNVVGIVRNLIDERASKTVGRIRMLHEGAMEGAAFDLPEEVALEVLAKKHELEVRPRIVLCAPHTHCAFQGPAHVLGAHA